MARRNAIETAMILRDRLSDSVTIEDRRSGRCNTQILRGWKTVKVVPTEVNELFGNERGRWVATFPLFNLDPRALPQTRSPFQGGLASP